MRIVLWAAEFLKTATLAFHSSSRQHSVACGALMHSSLPVSNLQTHSCSDAGGTRCFARPVQQTSTERFVRVLYAEAFRCRQQTRRKRYATRVERQELCEERQIASASRPDEWANNDVELNVNRTRVEKSAAIAMVISRRGRNWAGAISCASS